MNWITRLHRRYSGVLWICLIGGLFVLARMASVPLGTNADDLQSGTNFVASLLGAIFVTGCVSLTYIWVSAVSVRTKWEHFPGNKAAKVLVVFPSAVTLVMSPWLLTGFMTDPETSMPMSIFQWVLLAYAALLVGFLGLPFIVLPIWALFTGIWRVLHGDRSGWDRIFGALLLIGIETWVVSFAMGTTSAPGSTRINGYDRNKAGNFFWLMWASMIFLAIVYFTFTRLGRRAHRKRMKAEQLKAEQSTESPTHRPV